MHHPKMLYYQHVTIKEALPFWPGYCHIERRTVTNPSKEAPNGPEKKESGTSRAGCGVRHEKQRMRLEQSRGFKTHPMHQCF
jgi:hypothetical protein